jgi:hypothetical protein
LFPDNAINAPNTWQQSGTRISSEVLKQMHSKNLCVLERQQSRASIFQMGEAASLRFRTRKRSKLKNGPELKNASELENQREFHNSRFG